MRPSVLLRVSALASLAALGSPGLAAHAAHAQSVVAPSGVDPLAQGTRLRITAGSVHRGRAFVGTVVRRTSDSLVVDTMDVAAEQRMFFPVTVLVTRERRVLLPLAAIDTLQVSAGRSRSRGVVRVATRAALVGGLALGLNYMSSNRRPSFSRFSEGFRTGAILGASIAAPFGYRMGRERWTTIRGGRPPERPRVPRDPRIVADDSP